MCVYCGTPVHMTYIHTYIHLAAPVVGILERLGGAVFFDFSSSSTTTALSSHVVVRVTHGDTYHHTTRWNSDCWHYWSLKWVHFATNHEERHSTQVGWTYRNWWYNVRKTQTRFFWFLRFYVAIVRFSSHRLFVTYRIHRIYLVECAGGADTCSWSAILTTIAEEIKRNLTCGLIKKRNLENTIRCSLGFGVLSWFHNDNGRIYAKNDI